MQAYSWLFGLDDDFHSFVKEHTILAEGLSMGFILVHYLVWSVYRANIMREHQEQARAIVRRNRQRGDEWDNRGDEQNQ